MASTTERQYLSVREIADQLGVHPASIRRLIDKGTLPAYRVGNLLRVRRADLDDYLRPIPSAGSYRTTDVRAER